MTDAAPAETKTVTVRQLAGILNASGAPLAKVRSRAEADGDVVSLFVLVRGADQVAEVERVLDGLQEHWRRQALLKGAS